MTSIWEIFLPTREHPIHSCLLRASSCSFPSESSEKDVVHWKTFYRRLQISSRISHPKDVLLSSPFIFTFNSFLFKLSKSSLLLSSFLGLPRALFSTSTLGLLNPLFAGISSSTVTLSLPPAARGCTFGVIEANAGIWKTRYYHKLQWSWNSPDEVSDFWSLTDGFVFMEVLTSSCNRSVTVFFWGEEVGVRSRGGWGTGWGVASWVLLRRVRYNRSSSSSLKDDYCKYERGGYGREPRLIVANHRYVKPVSLVQIARKDLKWNQCPSGIWMKGTVERSTRVLTCSGTSEWDLVTLFPGLSYSGDWSSILR